MTVATTSNGTKDLTTKEPDLEEIRRQLREQREEIDRLNKALAEQQQIVNELRAWVNQRKSRRK